MKSLRIEKKSREYSVNSRVALDFLRRRGVAGEWITAEVLHTSGIPLDVVDAVLLKLAGEFNADVRVGPESEVLEFRFSELSKARWIYRLPARVQPLVEALWRRRRSWKMPLVGICTSTVLGLVALGYLGLFASMVPETMSSGQFAVLMGLLTVTLVLLMVVGVLLGLPIAFVVGLATGDFQPFLALLVPAGLIGLGLFVLRKPIAGLYEGVVAGLSSALNFGRPPQLELQMERDFLATAAAREGRLRIGDLMVLYGWPYDRAFHELTYLMLDYGGDVLVDESGQMLFVFDELSRSSIDVEEPAPIWERERSPREVFDRSARRADWIMIVLWNLLFTVPIYGVLNSGDQGLSTTMMLFMLALVFPVPLYSLMRRWVVARRQGQYEKRRRFLDELRYAVTSGGEVSMEAAEFDDRFVLDMGGDIDQEESTYVFPEFQRGGMNNPG